MEVEGALTPIRDLRIRRSEARIVSLSSTGTTVGVPTPGELSGISSQKEEHSVLPQMDTQEAADIPVLKQGKLKIINGVGIRRLVPNGQLQPFKDGCNLGCLNDETEIERAPAGRKTDCQIARTKKPLQLKIRSRKKECLIQDCSWYKKVGGNLKKRLTTKNI